MPNTKTSTLIIAEMREFASFASAEQRYVRRSLDIGLGRHDAFERWARDAAERTAIRQQYLIYQDLKVLRETMPCGSLDTMPDLVTGMLVRLAAFDLGEERLEAFGAFRFLYERLLDARIRPWLPAIFCAAAALPQIRPSRRRQLLQSLSDTAATAPGWSETEPRFFPEFVEVEAA